MRVLIALGGNAITREGQAGTWEEQAANTAEAAAAIAAVRAAGHQVVVSHGNGPQVGNLAIQAARAATEVPGLPLDALGAMTQGQIGYLLQQSLAAAAPEVATATLLTRVVVDAADPAFANPTKPVGPFYDETEATRIASASGWIVGPDAGRGWRRLVPSPHPIEVMELEAIRDLADAGRIVIAGGGGGVPVARIDGTLVGIEAVIDKDRLAGLLAAELGCDALVMLTGVARVAVGFGSPAQRDIARLTCSDARRLLADGEFPAGSMGPKMEIALGFAERGGGAIVTSAPHLAEALRGGHGTWVVPDADGPTSFVDAPLAA